MRPLSAEEQRQIVEELTSIELVRDLDAVSYALVSRLCDCATEDAVALVQSFVEQGLIARLSETGARSQPGVATDGDRWNWVKGRSLRWLSFG